MKPEFFDFGELPTPNENVGFIYPETKDLFEACLQNRSFRFLEYRKVTFTESDKIGEMLIVDCWHREIATRNEAGIFSRERLGLIYCPNLPIPYEVRALRTTFPDTIHQNFVIKGEPLSLCLYEKDWSLIERTWTPDQFLERILWWLKETSEGNLHAPDQTLEQLFFQSGFIVVLPKVFFDGKVNVRFQLTPIDSYKTEDKRKLHFLKPIPLPFDSQEQTNIQHCIVITPEPITHGQTVSSPKTLGELEKVFTDRGSSVLKKIKQQIKQIVSPNGISKLNSDKTFLLLRVLLKRTEIDEIEKSEVSGFIITKNLVELGQALGVITNFKSDEKYFLDYEIIKSEDGSNFIETERVDLSNIGIIPLNVESMIDPETSRILSGINHEGKTPKGILAGVGALGSLLAEIWAREGWGNWTFVDPDFIRSHNLIRHIALSEQIGMAKSEVTAFETNHVYDGLLENTWILGSILDFENDEIKKTIQGASLLVDATTTLGVPREIGLSNEFPRSASVFLTPNGKNSVLIMEDSERKFRLHALEPQYYRAVLNNEWGSNHLSDEKAMRIGQGCSDVSLILSNELIHIHGGTIARQLRVRSSRSDAYIVIWKLNDSTGQLSSIEVPPAPVFSRKQGNWTILWDEGFEKRIREIRSFYLPNETGGVVLGYFDQKNKILYLVDAQPPPPDSQSDPNWFVRGSKGLNEARMEWSLRTGGVVDYVGDWHSHPQGASSKPSSLDRSLFEYLSQEMATMGLLAIMIIVGEFDIEMKLG